MAWVWYQEPTLLEGETNFWKLFRDLHMTLWNMWVSYCTRPCVCTCASVHSHTHVKKWNYSFLSLLLPCYCRGIFSMSLKYRQLTAEWPKYWLHWTEPNLLPLSGTFSVICSTGFSSSHICDELYPFKFLHISSVSHLLKKLRLRRRNQWPFRRLSKAGYSCQTHVQHSGGCQSAAPPHSQKPKEYT